MKKYIYLEVNCRICNKSFTTNTGRISDGRGKYCSRRCLDKSLEKEKYCSYCNKLFSRDLKKRNIKFCSRECKMAGSYGQFLRTNNNTLDENGVSKLKGRKRLRGELAANWQGGKTKEAKRIRNSKEYALWRTAVFMRDDYTCQSCNARGGHLEADHIKPFALYPELRFAIDNGRTLCKSCHQQTDTWGFKFFNTNFRKLSSGK